jgi:hypothetical protein
VDADGFVSPKSSIVLMVASLKCFPWHNKQNSRLSFTCVSHNGLKSTHSNGHMETYYRWIFIISTETTCIRKGLAVITRQHEDEGIQHTLIPLLPISHTAHTRMLTVHYRRKTLCIPSSLLFCFVLFCFRIVICYSISDVLASCRWSSLNMRTSSERY